MNELTLNTLQQYIKKYRNYTNSDSLFIKLVEEIGEVAEILNIKRDNKLKQINITDELGKELADMIHYIIAIANVHDINLEQAIIEKDIVASIKYKHNSNLKTYMNKKE